MRGRVVQGDRDVPVAGASVIYQPDRSNPQRRNNYSFDNPVLTDGDGRFALAALPGAGLLAVEAPTSEYIRVALPGAGTGPNSQALPHGFARIDLPQGEEPAVPEVRLAIKKGVNLEARLVAPDGSRGGLVMGWCEEMLASQLQNWGSPQAFVDGWFRLNGADPDRTYRVFLVEPKRKLGRVAELKYDPKGPAVIRLQAAATAKGTVVDRNGRPIKHMQILPVIDLTRGDRELKEKDFYDQSHASFYFMWLMKPLLQTYPAEFIYDALIPGVHTMWMPVGRITRLRRSSPARCATWGRLSSIRREASDANVR